MVVKASFEIPIDERIDVVLAWLEKDIKSNLPAERFEAGNLRISFYYEMSHNIIDIRSRIFVVSENQLSEGESVARFQVSRVTEIANDGSYNRSIIKCTADTDHLQYEKLTYFFLARLGAAFKAEWKKSMEESLKSIQREIEKRQGGHLGLTDWKVDEKTGWQSRAYALIPNHPEATPNSQVADDRAISRDRSLEQKGIDDYSIGSLLEFEKGKTPKGLFMFISSVGYLNNPTDPGAIGLMRRIYNALRGARDALLELKETLPNLSGIVDLILYFEKAYPMLSAENMAEEQVLREVALTIVNIYKNPKEAAAQSTQFFNNSELLPKDKRALLQQIRTMTIGDASVLLAAQPLIAKLRNEYVETKRESTSLPTVHAVKDGAEKPAKLSRKELLDQACVEWVNRDVHGYLGRYTRDEFLEDFQEKTGELITKDEFRRALEDAKKRGIIEKRNGRLRPKTGP